MVSRAEIINSVMNSVCVEKKACHALDFSCLLSFQYAMFLSLVFLAELVAGISGFVFRHEVGGNVLRLHVAVPPWARAAEKCSGAWTICRSLSSAAPYASPGMWLTFNNNVYSS